MSQVMERVDLKSLIEEVMTRNELELEIKMNFKPKKKS
jgi:hypothetical protein